MEKGERPTALTACENGGFRARLVYNHQPERASDTQSQRRGGVKRKKKGGGRK